MLSADSHHRLYGSFTRLRAFEQLTVPEGHEISTKEEEINMLRVVEFSLIPPD